MTDNNKVVELMEILHREVDKSTASVVDVVRVLSQGITDGDNALLSLIEALIKKVDLLESRVFECECQLQEGPSTRGRKVN
jgi:uncharacterized protein (UPF0210 family)